MKVLMVEIWKAKASKYFKMVIGRFLVKEEIVWNMILDRGGGKNVEKMYNKMESFNLVGR